MEDSTSVVDAAPAAAPAAPAAAPSSTPAPSQSVDYSKTSDDAILSDAFGRSEESPTEETPADDSEVKSLTEAKPVDEVKKDEPTEEDLNPDNEPEPEDLKRVFKAHPEARAAWYRDKQFRQVFETPAEARSYRELFPTLEYANTVMEQAQTLLAADNLFVNDPETFAARLSEGNQQAFFSLLGAARKVAYGKSPELYRSMYAEPVLRDIVTNLRQAATEGNDEDLRIALEIIEDRTGSNAKSRAPQGPQDPRVDAYEKLKADAARAREESGQAFQATVQREVGDGIRKVVTDSVAKPSGMTDKAYSRMVDDVVTDIYSALRSNQHVGATVGNMERQGDFSAQHRQQIVDFVTRHAKQLAPSRVRTHVNAWTKDILAANGAELSKARSVPNRKDVGTSSGAPGAGGKPRGPIDYRKVTDDDILSDNF